MKSMLEFLSIKLIAISLLVDKHSLLFGGLFVKRGFNSASSEFSSQASLVASFLEVCSFRGFFLNLLLDLLNVYWISDNISLNNMTSAAGMK